MSKFRFFSHPISSFNSDSGIESTASPDVKRQGTVDPDLTLTTVLQRDSVRAISAQAVEMTFHSSAGAYTVLKGIDLQISPGKIEFIMGPSGSGKTTLLLILAGLLTPTTGKVQLLGTEITSLSRRELAQFRLENIGFIFQGFNLFSALTARENISVALELKGINSTVARQQAMELLDKVEIADKARLLPRDLSGGEKQRVAIARALAGNPRIILADEPTAALDAENGRLIMKLLRQLSTSGERTVLVVTHDRRLVSDGEQVVQLENGILLATV
jgi:putative ABC transport system ATP-binding protein